MKASLLDIGGAKPPPTKTNNVVRFSTAALSAMCVTGAALYYLGGSAGDAGLRASALAVNAGPYKPIFFFQGLNEGPEDFDNLISFIQDTHPGKL